ncbi:hypothetical protein C7534_1386 [Pseudomonas sp. OV226]|nr:hypothetical protein C7534_1386 [Pseudomonas sp. OV226]
MGTGPIHGSTAFLLDSPLRRPRHAELVSRGTLISVRGFS